jgi:hypothetical protein
MRDRFTFFRSFYEAIKKLPVENQLPLYNAIFEFALNDKKLELSYIEEAFMMLIYPNIIASNNDRDSGSQGGRPSKKDPQKGGNETPKPPFQETETHLSDIKKGGNETPKPPSSMDNGLWIVDYGLLEEGKEKEMECGLSARACEETSVKSFVSYNDLREILKNVCPTMLKRLDTQVNSGKLYLIGSIESTLQELDFNAAQLTKLFAHVHKTWICKPGESHFDVMYVLKNIPKVNSYPDDRDLTDPKAAFSDSGISETALTMPLDEYLDFLRYSKDLATRYFKERGIVCEGYEPDGEGGVNPKTGWKLDEHGIIFKEV